VLADPAVSATPDAAAGQLVRAGRRLADRGLSPGTSGNLSVRTSGGFLATPTGAELSALDGSRLAVLGPDGRHVTGPPPTKETFFHLACYRARPATGAVVHLHSRAATAVSCLAGLDPRSTLPPLTPYFVMRVGRLPLVPYFRPGDERLGPAVEQVARGSACLLLANHGSVVTGPDLASATAAAEELEETAALFLLLFGHAVRPLDPDQTTELERVFGASWE